MLFFFLFFFFFFLLLLLLLLLLLFLSLPLYSDLITSSLESVVDQGIIGLEWTSMSAAGDLGPCLASTLVHLLRLKSLENAMAPIWQCVKTHINRY